MDIGALNVKIMFQHSSTVVDEIGNRKSKWEDYYGCHATVSGEYGSESEKAGVTVDNADTSFTVRFCLAASAVDIKGYRILFQGEVYDIVAIDHLHFKKNALKFRCRKARR